MTSRRYYDDSYTTRFPAAIVERTTLDDGRPAVVLDQTYFYPTSGGQPHDTGRIGTARVVDVQIRAADGAVVHTLDGDPGSEPVDCEIDWARRFDHMQQHTGQHILSQSFIRLADATTIGFHLGDEYVSIDLDRADGAELNLEAAFALANDVIGRSGPIKAWFPSPEQLSQLELRKTPDVEGALRIVAIGDFDVSACGGTHVGAAGEVGFIHHLWTERLKRGLRVAFLTGGRARADYSRKHRILADLARELTCSTEEIPTAVTKLRSELLTTRKALAHAHEADLGREAETLRGAATTTAGLTVVARAWEERTPDDLRGLALRITSVPNTVALLGSAGEKATLVAARSEELGFAMSGPLKAGLAALGGGRGGGARIALGGGIPATVARVVAALEAARAALPAAPAGS